MVKQQITRVAWRGAAAAATGLKKGMEMKKSMMVLAAVSDLTGVGAASLVAPNAVHRLSDGEHTFTAGGVSQGFTVAGKKWNAPKQNKKADPDPNPTGLKLSFTEKTGAVKGSYTVVDGKVKTKYTVVGVVVGGKFYGSAYARNAGSASATAE